MSVLELFGVVAESVWALGVGAVAIGAVRLGAMGFVTEVRSCLGWSLSYWG